MTSRYCLVLLLSNVVYGAWRCPSRLGDPVNCGWDQTVETPLVYPRDAGAYNNNAHCLWNVTAPQGKRIRAEFTRFDLQTKPTYENCRDTIEVSWDGFTTGRFCTKIEPIEVIHDIMIVEFRSDEDVAGAGFTLNFETMESVDVKTCGGNLRPGDSITMAHQYGNKQSMDCQWTITAPIGKRVVARFTKFSIWWNQAGLSPCSFDYLQVSPIGGDSVKYCGNFDGSPLLEQLISLNNVMKLVLHTEKRIGGFGGFHINFEAVELGSVVTQQIVNLFNHFPSGKTYVEGGRKYYLYIAHNSRQIYLYYGMTAQLTHDVGSSMATISFRTEWGQEATIKSEPGQSWVVTNNGIYRQDRSSNLTSIVSKKPDAIWSTQNRTLQH